jgi:hypothetical protein
MKYSLTRADEKAKHKPGKWREQINRLLLEIEDLNERTIELPMPEEYIIDVNALRAGPKPSEEKEQEREKTNEGMTYTSDTRSVV